MHPVAVLLVVAAALAHAGWNLCAKRVPTGGALFVWLAAAVGTAVLLPVAAVVVATSGTGGAGRLWLAAVVSGLLHLGYFVLLQRGYRVGDLSVVYPLARGTGPLLAVLAAVLVLGERPGVAALVGAAAVVAGVWVIGGLGRSGGGGLTAGIGYGVATGAVIATYTLWDAHAVTGLAVSPLLLLAGTGVVETAVLAPYAMARSARVRELWRTSWPQVLGVAVLSPLAYLLILFAMRLAPVSMVAPARELSIVVAGIAAWLLLGEPHPARRLGGAVLVLAGVTAIAMG